MALRRLALIALPAALMLGVLTTAVPSLAASTTPGIAVGHCTKTSLADLQVQREDTGQLSIDFGVDRARHTAGVTWKVRVTDNRTVIVRTRVRTIADGSFSITRLITPKRGTNHIVATATNPKTGETCRLTATP